MSIADNDADIVRIPGTRRKVKVSWIKPYTIERLTRLWLERDDAAEKVADGAAVLKDMCREPYFAIKEACIFALNNYFSLRLLFWLKWRIWAYVYGYTDDQVMPIIMAGKKKLPLMAHYSVMVFTTDIRADWKKMTAKEAEQYRAELLSAQKQLSSKSSPSTESQSGFSSVGSETGATAAS